MFYFDSASTTYPKPESVYKAMDAMARNAANPGRTAHSMAVEAERIIEKCRNATASFFNLKRGGKNVVFTLNATDALNIAIKGILKNGGHVVTTVCEHNSVLRPLNRLKEQGVIEVDFVPPRANGIVSAEDIRKAMKKNTVLTAVVHASNVFGTVQPVREIGKLAREHSSLFLVDAAQTAGVLNIDVEADNIDVLVVPGHKALYGPMGTGVLCLNTDKYVCAFREGGTGVDSESPLQPDELPVRLEAGTPNMPGIAGLLEGINFIQRTGMDVIAAHKRELTTKFLDYVVQEKRLKGYFPDGLTPDIGTVSFNMDCLSPQELGTLLAQNFEMAVRTGLHCAPLAHKFANTIPDGCVRVSFGYFNTISEVDALINAITEILKEFV